MNNKFVVYFVNLQPVDLLPFRIEDARRQLELEGDFSFEALTLLREAEEERRGKLLQLTAQNRFKISSPLKILCTFVKLFSVKSAKIKGSLENDVNDGTTMA